MFYQGLCFSVIGPTIPSMEILLDTNTSLISATFTGSGLGFLLGCIACAMVYDRVNKEILFAVALAGKAKYTYDVLLLLCYYHKLNFNCIVGVITFAIATVIVFTVSVAATVITATAIKVQSL